MFGPFSTLRDRMGRGRPLPAERSTVRALPLRSLLSTSSCPGVIIGVITFFRLLADNLARARRVRGVPPDWSTPATEERETLVIEQTIKLFGSR